MRLTFFPASMLCLLVLGQPVLAQAPPEQQLDSIVRRHQREIGERLQQAASSARVRIDPAIVVETNANDATSILSPATDLESYAAASQPQGLVVAFGYFRLPAGPGTANPSLSAGFYTVRMRASQRTIDTFDRTAEAVRPSSGSARLPRAEAQFEFVDGGGRVAARVAGGFGTRTPPRVGNPGGSAGPAAFYYYPFDRGTSCIHIGRKWLCWGEHWELAQQIMPGI